MQLCEVACWSKTESKQDRQGKNAGLIMTKFLPISAVSSRGEVRPPPWPSTPAYMAEKTACATGRYGVPFVQIFIKMLIQHTYITQYTNDLMLTVVTRGSLAYSMMCM